MKHFVLRRKGKFTSIATSGEYHWCKDNKHKEYSYEICIVTEDRNQHLVILHEDVDQQVKDTKPYGTCEDMVSQICNGVKELLTRRDVVFNLIHVKLLPIVEDNNPVANMEYCECNSKEDLILTNLI